MPNPTAAAVHVDRLLTNISVGFMQDPAGFVADRVFPNLPVAKQSAIIPRYDRADFNRNQFQLRASGTPSAGSGWKTDNTLTYFAKIWALHKDIGDPEAANADDPYNLERDATQWLTEQALISRDVTWASNYFTTGKWTGVTGSAQDITGVSGTPSTNQVEQWNEAASTPIADVKKYSDTIHLLTFRRPNKLVVGRQVWTQLSEHSDLVARIQYGNTNSTPTVLSLQAAAAIFEIGEVLVADGVKVTSAENPTFETSITTAFIAGKAGLLVYAAPSPSLYQPSGGYTFSWTGYLPGQGPQGQVISSFRMEELKSQRVEAEMSFDQKLISSDCGVYFTTLVA